jgi:hypothetical protein
MEGRKKTDQKSASGVNILKDKCIMNLGYTLSSDENKLLVKSLDSC